MDWLKNTVNWLLEAIFPNNYSVSGIKISDTFFCVVCKARLPNQKKICHKDSHCYLAAATSYREQKVRDWVWRLKYRGATGNARPLATLLAAYLKNLNLPLEKYLIVPVPLSSQRFRERGYNQSELIADLLKEKLGIEVASDVLVRIRHTAPQAELNEPKKRVNNVAGCFTVSELPKNKRAKIILLDDVCTSGSTLQEAAKALKKAGFKNIIGLVVAKAGQ
ncbi:MAG: amidophosphoribosyltransferase-like protein [Parcubacteria group bacterium Gr01-1014_3]|nr:MAG: amidophosphoribosyltransferase-like protein [Parcubacteria group bacterium Gr01-1014_3]